MSERSGVTGKTPHQVARADSLREITDAKLVRGGIIDLCAYLQEFWKNDILLTAPEESRGRPEQLVRRELGRSGSRSDPGVPPIGAPGWGNGPG